MDYGQVVRVKKVVDAHKAYEHTKYWVEQRSETGWMVLLVKRKLWSMRKGFGKRRESNVKY